MSNNIRKDFSTNDAVVIRLLNNLQSQQAIVVRWEKGYQADLGLYERTEGCWELVQRMTAVVGRNGMGKGREGDQKSPCGIFRLGTAFGIAPKPEGCRYPYRVLTAEDYWVDDSRSKDYNRWVCYQEGDEKNWESAERLGKETVCYKYAVVINYNSEGKPGKGSAIFLHVWEDENSPTQGCTAVSEESMIRILKWLDLEKRPVIIQGSCQNIYSITKEQINLVYLLPDSF